MDFNYKKVKEICAMLGDDYTIRVIDLENVIYKALENGFDFEISGLDNNKKIKRDLTNNNY